MLSAVLVCLNASPPGHLFAEPGLLLLVATGVSNTTRFTGFGANQTFYAPTDVVWVISRVQSFNDSDVAYAYQLGQGVQIAPYNGSYVPAGRLATCVSGAPRRLKYSPPSARLIAAHDARI